MADEDLEGLTEDQIKAARAGYVPLDRLNEVSNKAKEENSRLRESLSALEMTVNNLKETTTAKQSDQPSSTPEKVFTRAELRQFIEQGQLSQIQADDIWDKQQEQKFERRLEEKLNQVTSQTAQITTVKGLESQIAEYTKVLPDVIKEGSESRDSVRKEYQKLARVMGNPKPNSKEDYQMQVLALEAAFGSVDDVKRKQSRQSEPELDTMDETPASTNAGKIPSKGALKGLSQRQKEYYQGAISKGLYKGWDDVEKELSYTRKTR